MKAGKGNFANDEFDSITIERARGLTYASGKFAVYGHSHYPQSSVLAGRPMRSYINGDYETAEAALADYPMAEVLDGSTHVHDSFADLPGEDDPDPLGENRALAGSY